MAVYRRANRQYVAMSRGEVWRFLRSQERVFLGFAMDDGYAHVTPIWFVLIGERIYMRAQSYKVKVELAANGKACVAVDQGRKYGELRGAVLWGRCRFIPEGRLLSKVTGLFEQKYSELQWDPDEMPEGWVRERAGEKRAYIEFIPEKVDSWDNRKVALSASRPGPRRPRGR